jgi:uncharacterized protein (DUF2236 family)
MDEMKSYLGWKIDYSLPKGEPAFHAPDSIKWKVFKNPVIGAIGGVCAVLLEFADSRIRTGVWDHSVFPTDPIGRAQRTGVASNVGIFGPQSAARRVIQGVTNMHSKVSGTTPDGRDYKALDTELLDWVSATAAYGWFMAYHTYVRKLSSDEERRYFSEGGEVPKLYGVQNQPKSLEDFYAMMEKLEPGFESHPINTEFLDVVQSGKSATQVPAWMRRALAHASIEILPPQIRQVLELGPEFDLKWHERMFIKSVAWKYETFADTKSPAAQASERLGLPRDFLWKSDAAQAEILANARSEQGLAQAF